LAAVGDEAGMKTTVAIDSLAIRDGRVFGWGWLLHEKLSARHIEIRVPMMAGEPARLSCLRGVNRPDLAKAFPDVAHAAGGGFLIQGRIHGDVASDASLFVTYEDGSSEQHEIIGFPYRFVAIAAEPQVLREKAGNAMRLLRRAGLRSLLARVWQLGRERLDRSRGHRELAKVAAAAEQAECVIIFDHAMGGGANHFRNTLVLQHLRMGRVLYLVTPDLPTLSYRVTRQTADSHGIADYPTLPEALAVIEPLSPGIIIINDLVSFDDPQAVLAWASARRNAGARLLFYLHDFLSACPSWTLMNDRDRFCDLPDATTCRLCLARNAVPFLSFYPEAEVPTWRAMWREFFERCDEIVAFSSASVELLLRAHPTLPRERIQIRPHEIDYLPARVLQPSLASPLVVAVIGNISLHKGADVVRDAVAHAKATQAPIRFVVIGTVVNGIASDMLTITGPYVAAELPDLLERHRVGICLLPSVCPETFSYVTAEIIHFGMPLAVFNLGAPAERARNYSRGIILDGMDGKSVVEGLLAFHATLVGNAQTQQQQGSQVSI